MAQCKQRFLPVELEGVTTISSVESPSQWPSQQNFITQQVRPPRKGQLFPPKIRRKNKNTFKMSRKIDAAISGAEATSLERRRR